MLCLQQCYNALCHSALCWAPRVVDGAHQEASLELLLQCTQNLTAYVVRGFVEGHTALKPAISFEMRLHVCWLKLCMCFQLSQA